MNQKVKEVYLRLQHILLLLTEVEEMEQYFELYDTPILVCKHAADKERVVEYNQVEMQDQNNQEESQNFHIVLAFLLITAVVLKINFATSVVASLYFVPFFV